ncbi:hypothetical protein Nepgr_031325 [Nepenthes gracilis]|uniref:Uncharacterized protein n=1 Tax=Nepenthes gracilis TaxID=150966 RepID=A0AAD3THB8_NEPGR|nr:hypothetical protein Nepgr_031325 [Nepenthes gracilis]
MLGLQVCYGSAAKLLKQECSGIGCNGLLYSSDDLPDFENTVRCISRSWFGNHCQFVVVVICNSFLKAVVGPCCSLCGRVGTLLSLCSLLNCGEMWCCCLAFNVGLLRLLGALAPAAVLVASAGVLMCISWECCSILKDLVQPIFFWCCSVSLVVYPIML